MNHPPAHYRAMSIEELTAESRRALKNAVPVVAQLPKVWSVTEGRWVFNRDHQST